MLALSPQEASFSGLRQDLTMAKIHLCCHLIAFHVVAVVVVCRLPTESVNPFMQRLQLKHALDNPTVHICVGDTD